jgi:hypothetical protein
VQVRIVLDAQGLNGLADHTTDVARYLFCKLAGSFF